MYPAYIPAADADFETWLANFDALLTANPTTYGLVAGDAVIVAAVAATFAVAYPISQAPTTRTPVTVADKDVARVAAEAVVRPYAVDISLNAAVTPANKTAIGVTVRSTNPTPIPAPIAAPELSVQSMIPGQLTLAIKDPGAAGKAKPFGSVGVEVWTANGAVAATLPSECALEGIYTKSPSRIAMAPGDAGKFLTVFARYVTRSGPGGTSQPGPWSVALQTVSV